MNADLKNVCENALEIGKTIDLTGCVYGYREKFKRVVGTRDYYRLLAGLARTQDMHRVLEIGTFKGGSAMSISRGTPPAPVNNILVTVDIKAYNKAGLAEFPDIQQVIGDSLLAKTKEKIATLLGPAPLDMLFIDSFHGYDAVMSNYRGYTGPGWQPRFIVFDDIHLNAEMEKAWLEISSSTDAFDASDLVNRPCGFGVVVGRRM